MKTTRITVDEIQSDLIGFLARARSGEKLIVTEYRRSPVEITAAGIRLFEDQRGNKRRHLSERQRLIDLQA